MFVDWQVDLYTRLWEVLMERHVAYFFRCIVNYEGGSFESKSQCTVPLPSFSTVTFEERLSSHEIQSTRMHETCFLLLKILALIKQLKKFDGLSFESWILRRVAVCFISRILTFISKKELGGRKSERQSPSCILAQMFGSAQFSHLFTVGVALRKGCVLPLFFIVCSIDSIII